MTRTGVLLAAALVLTGAAAHAQTYPSRQITLIIPFAPGGSNDLVGRAIMARAPKSRAACHFAAAIGLRSMLRGFAPEIPDWANDQHTLAGKKLGRGLGHFRSEGAKLVPPPTEPDPYEDEAYRLWAIKQQGK